MANVILPELGEGITKATVAFWHYKVGQSIQKGDDVVELVTDKATFNVPASASGILLKVVYAEGQDVKVGEVLAVIEPI